MLTLSQHIKLFRDFATAHSQIKSFNEGLPEVLTETNHANADERLTYPIMFIEVLPPSVNGNQFNTPYNVYILDRLDKDATNRTQVLENTMLIAHDTLAYFKNQPSSWNNVLDTSNITFDELEYTRADALAGYLFPVTFKQAMQYNKCDIPYNL